MAAIGYAEVITLMWVYNEHGLGWTIATFVILPSTAVVAFIAGIWYGVILWVGLGAYSVGGYLIKGYWESDEDHLRTIQDDAFIAASQTTERAWDEKVQHLQALYANRVSFGAQLQSEYVEINRVYGMLRDAGGDADQSLVDSAKAENAEWISANPWLKYHEPHLNRSRFDEERPDRRR